jgi:hypothetical protein
VGLLPPQFLDAPDAFASFVVGLRSTWGHEKQKERKAKGASVNPCRLPDCITASVSAMQTPGKVVR